MSGNYLLEIKMSFRIEFVAKEIIHRNAQTLKNI